MASIDNLDFLNLNSLRAYPLRETCSRISTNQIFEIPNSLILDFQLAATTDPTRRFYLSRLTYSVDQLVIEVSDDLGNVVGNFFINTATHSDYTTYYLNPTNTYDKAHGAIVIGGLEVLEDYPTGTYDFTLLTAEFEMRTIVLSQIGVSRITFANAEGGEFTLTGNVRIAARNNLRFKKDEENNRIILDAGDNLGLNEACEDDGLYIKTINGIPPDEHGNFTLDFSDCAVLTPIPANTGLILQDSCCKPCLGCSDIGELTNRLNVLESNLLVLRQYFTNLETLFEEYKTTTSYNCDCE